MKNVCFVVILWSCFTMLVRAETPKHAGDYFNWLVAETVRTPECEYGAPEWVGCSLIKGITVYGYPPEAAVYRIDLILDNAQAVKGLIGVDAHTDEWQWYNKNLKKDRFPEVSESQAKAIAQKIMGNKLPTPDMIVVSMPDKHLYWYAKTNMQVNNVTEVFIDIDDASRVATNDTKQKLGLMNGLDNGDPSFVAASPRNYVNKQNGLQVTYKRAEVNLTVPFYYQVTSWYCGEAALEMVFDYYGPDINQYDIGDVANENVSWGSYADDCRRAAHFSDLSTAIQNVSLQGYNERDIGYAAMQAFWSNAPRYANRFTDMKAYITGGYPFYVLTYYDSSHGSGHFRVPKGFSDNATTFIVHDPWYSAPYYGPDVSFSQTFFVDNLWTRYSRWGCFITPWQGTITAPSLVIPSQQFTVSILVTYPALVDVTALDAVTSPQATMTLPSGYALVSGSLTQTLTGITDSGDSSTVSWTVQAPSTNQPESTISISYQGIITSSSSSYGSYTDRIGGVSTHLITTNNGATATFSPTSTLSKTMTRTPTLTPSQTATSTPSRTATRTPTVTTTPTRTSTLTASPTQPTVTPTRTSTVSQTPSRTATFTASPTGVTSTPTVTNTPSRTPSRTPTMTPSATLTRTSLATLTITPSPTATVNPLPVIPLNTSGGILIMLTAFGVMLKDFLRARK